MSFILTVHLYSGSINNRNNQLIIIIVVHYLSADQIFRDNQIIYASGDIDLQNSGVQIEPNMKFVFCIFRLFVYVILWLQITILFTTDCDYLVTLGKLLV